MSFSRWIIRIAVTVAIISVYLPHIRRALGGVKIEPAQLSGWVGTPYLNNHCVVDKTADACEDVKVHFASNTAFLACGDPEGRTKYYPSAGRHNATARGDFREKLFKYDILEKKTTELRIDGLDGDFIAHGLDVFELPGGDKVSAPHNDERGLGLHVARSTSWP